MNRFACGAAARWSVVVAMTLSLAGCFGEHQSPFESAAGDASESLMMAKLSAPAPAPAPAPASGGAALAERHIAVRHRLEVVLPAAQIADAWKAVAESCARLDCEVLSSSVRKELVDQPAGARLEMRVNPKDAEQLLGQVEGVGRVASHSTSSEDMTAEVVDVEAHIKNRTEFRDSLRALLQQAGTNRKLSDVLDIQHQPKTLGRAGHPANAV